MNLAKVRRERQFTQVSIAFAKSAPASRWKTASNLMPYVVFTAVWFGLIYLAAAS